MFRSEFFLALATLLHLASGDPLIKPGISFNGPYDVEAGGVQNIHIEYHGPLDGELSISYGACGRALRSDSHHDVGRTHIGGHPLAKRHVDWIDMRPTSFVWLPPKDIDQGCLQAHIDDQLVGESEQFVVKRRINRRGTFADFTDPVGPWFDGVEYLNQKQPDEVFVASVKSKRFGILGAGMAGLMTALLFESVGIHNWQILESSNRLGGRVRTVYLNGTSPEDYQYAEMGPMRFPTEITDRQTNETIELLDHRMVFQLADALNNMNGNDTSLAVNFIPFVMWAQNVPGFTSRRRPDGTIPTVAEVAANPAQYGDNATAQMSDPAAVQGAQAAYDEWLGFDRESIKAMAKNMWKAHKVAVESGHFDFSEAGYLRYILDMNRNVTDQVDSISNIYPSWPFENLYFSGTTWRTIEKGLNRLPNAFWPLVKDRIQFNSKVQSIAFDTSTNTHTVSSLPPNAPPSTPYTTSSFDYLTIAVPFSQIRLWRFSPPHSSLLTRAIQRLPYDPACKVALQYRTRFWEHLPLPIHGGCAYVTLPNIGSICYPSYGINSTGPGVLLASYNMWIDADTVGSLSPEEHAAYVQRAIVEAHGQIAADEYTGVFERLCWQQEDGAGGAWAGPGVGQHPLYMPAYWQTEMGRVFVGEHTSVTHSWIFSALESAVRGAAQMLLDLGLVDEAKQVTREWMARWISV